MQNFSNSLEVEQLSVADEKAHGSATPPRVSFRVHMSMSVLTGDDLSKFPSSSDLRPG